MKSLAILSAAASAGYAIGLLAAPRKGRETRAVIHNSYQDLVNKVKNHLKIGRARSGEFVDKLQHKSEQPDVGVAMVADSTGALAHERAP